MPMTTEFDQMMQRIRTGDDSGMQQLVAEYGHLLLAVIRRYFRRDMRARFDSHDFAQAVWISLYRKREELGRFQNPRALMGYLSRMAIHKVIDEGRRQTGAKRDVRLEVHLSDVAGSRERSNPTASDVAVANERLEELLDQERPDLRSMVRLRLQGHTIEDIARRVDRDERTVRRLFRRIRSRMLRREKRLRVPAAGTGSSQLELPARQ